MSNKTQTTVDFLVKEISAILGTIQTSPMQDLLLVDAINKAKELEKQQIIDAYEQGEEDGYWHPENGYSRKFNDAEDYYNETYGGNK